MPARASNSPYWLDLDADTFKIAFLRVLDLLLPPGIVHTIGSHTRPDHSAIGFATTTTTTTTTTPLYTCELISCGCSLFLRSSFFATFPRRKRGWRSEDRGRKRWEREREKGGGCRGSGVVYSHLSRVKVTGRCAHKSVNPRGEGSAEASNPSR